MKLPDIQPRLGVPIQYSPFAKGLLDKGQVLIMYHGGLKIVDMNRTKKCSIGCNGYMVFLIRNNGWTTFVKDWGDTTYFATITSDGVCTYKGTGTSTLTVDSSMEYVVVGRYTGSTSTTINIYVS